MQSSNQDLSFSFDVQKFFSDDIIIDIAFVKPAQGAIKEFVPHDTPRENEDESAIWPSCVSRVLIFLLFGK